MPWREEWKRPERYLASLRGCLDTMRAVNVPPGGVFYVQRLVIKVFKDLKHEVIMKWGCVVATFDAPEGDAGVVVTARVAGDMRFGGGCTDEVEGVILLRWLCLARVVVSPVCDGIVGGGDIIKGVTFVGYERIDDAVDLKDFDRARGGAAFLVVECCASEAHDAIDEVGSITGHAVAHVTAVGVSHEEDLADVIACFGLCDEVAQEEEVIIFKCAEALT